MWELDIFILFVKYYVSNQKDMNIIKMDKIFCVLINRILWLFEFFFRYNANTTVYVSLFFQQIFIKLATLVLWLRSMRLEISVSTRHAHELIVFVERIASRIRDCAFLLYIYRCTALRQTYTLSFCINFNINLYIFLQIG